MYWVVVATYRHRVFDAQAIDAPRDIFADACSDADATLVEMAASCADTSSGRKLRLTIHDSFAVRAILPRPEGRGLPLVLVNATPVGASVGR